MVYSICDELKHLPLPKEKFCTTKDGISNLLSMGKLVKEEYQVTMNSDVENVINVYNEDNSYIKFVCVQGGLYCINLDSSGEDTIFLPQFPNRRIISLILITRELPWLDTFSSACAFHLTLILPIQLIKVELRSVGLTEGTSILPMSSLGLPRPRWKERRCRERTRCHVIVV